MRTIRAFIAILHVLIVPFRLFAQEVISNDHGWYGEVGGEISAPVGEYSDGASIGIGIAGMVGRTVAPSTSVGLQYVYNRHSTSGFLKGLDGSITSSAFFVGVHHVTRERLSFAGNSRISLMAGLGIGFTSLNVDNAYGEGSYSYGDNNPAIQLGVGLMIPTGSETKSEYIQPSIRYRTLLGGDVRAAVLALNVSWAGWM